MATVDTLSDPAAVLCVLFLLAVILSFRRLGWLGRGVFMVGLAALYFLSTPVGADLLLRSLETRYPPLFSAPNADVAAIVVLTGGEGWDGGRPITSALSTSSTDRLVEAIRVWRMLGEGVPILFVGGIGEPGGHAEAPLMAQAAIALGVPQEALSWEAASRNTYENALAVREMLGDHRFVLVTSAVHMPRAMAVFQKLGMDPIPAPGGYGTRTGRDAWDYVPRSQSLWYSARAIREHLALLWYRLRYR